MAGSPFLELLSAASGMVYSVSFVLRGRDECRKAQCRIRISGLTAGSDALGRMAQSWLDFMRCGRMCALSAVSKCHQRVHAEIYKSPAGVRIQPIAVASLDQMRARIGGVESDIVDIVTVLIAHG